jgi:hypothetical protein
MRIIGQFLGHTCGRELASQVWTAGLQPSSSCATYTMPQRLTVAGEAAAKSCTSKTCQQSGPTGQLCQLVHACTGAHGPRLAMTHGPRLAMTPDWPVWVSSPAGQCTGNTIVTLTVIGSAEKLIS